MIEKGFFRVNLLFICVMIGTVLCSAGVAPRVAKYYIRLLFAIIPGDRPLRPLVEKNLDSHSLKNMKTNLFFCFTITFLIYNGSNFAASQKYLAQMADIMFGSDINIKSLTQGYLTVLNEE